MSPVIVTSGQNPDEIPPQTSPESIGDWTKRVVGNDWKTRDDIPGPRLDGS